ncbi:hypothetical protein EHS25_005068 [Saitozyma podzolica]|uniref:Uncharacterized protein n=1 Tax=Saitozyma podzolica TaxID=1890683 RepID=A0A427Y2F5_9TREE|nr:hypothetical protein EHS25_005068 [Saitozyma podzolica]
MSERTPLLSGELQPQHPRRNSASSNHAPSASTTPWTLQSAATALVVQTRHSLSPSSSDSTPAPAPTALPDGTAELAVHLYALYLVSSIDVRSSGGGIRSQLVLATVNARSRDALCDAIEEILDGEQRVVEDEETSADETALDRTEQGEVERMLWGQWDVDGSGKMACAVDLLLPGYIKRSSPFLSHPLVRHALHTAWYRGVHLDAATATGTGVATGGGLATAHLSSIRRAITPARLHFLYLTSLSIVFGLTLSIALHPGRWITPYALDPQDPTPPANVSPVEVIYLIYAFSWIADLVLHPSSGLTTILSLPTISSLLSLPCSRTTSFNSTVLSIPALTTLLVLPLSPSVPLVYPTGSLMPLSTLLLSTMNRSLRPLALLLPIVILLFIAFSWSMNGDIFRAFLVFPTISTLSNISNMFPTPTPTFAPEHSQRSPLLPMPHILAQSSPPPSEYGVAPFQSRLSLFITLILLLLYALTLGIARSFTPSFPTSDGAHRWRGRSLEDDEWEAEYGPVLARRARRRFAEALRRYLVVEPESSIHATDSLIHAEIERGATEIENGTDVVEGVEGVEARRVRLPNRRERKSILVVPPFNVLCLPLDLLLTMSRALPGRALPRTRHVLFVAREGLAVGLMGPFLQRTAADDALNNVFKMTQPQFAGF